MTVSHTLPTAAREEQAQEQEQERECIYDVIIIGAGPCGLAVAARLQEETPSAIFTDEEHQRYHWIRKHSGRMALVRAHNRKMSVKAHRYVGLDEREGCHCKMGPAVNGDANSEVSSRLSTLVLDSSGDRWMERWNRAFRSLEIDHLRSPMFFHVDPGDRDGLLAYARETGREGELCEISGCVGHELSKHKRKKMRLKR
ncbi:hypothetical protein VTN77DRAFT_1885 [Rasamsonia byssochlamydoides]|uniref:uncharacterized protein n=1 Tax=Rasamsonia byssochlamydoides TaxID=89139 RepID=UPI003743D0EB